MSEFSDKEEKLLKPFVSNLDKPVFVLQNLPEVVKGALFSKYSRSNKSLRRVLLDDFILRPEVGFKEVVETSEKSGVNTGAIDTEKAEEFYDRVLVGFGDDSIAELAGAHIALEDISIIATKIVEDSRIGLSPLEKSTRYVYFDEKRDGKWLYLREPTLIQSGFSELYEQTCDLCFQTYSDLIPKISEYVMERETRDSKTSDRAYKSAIRAKTCDILRGLLPASTLTNMGFFGNGRAYEYLLMKMYADELKEMTGLAGAMEKELKTIIPSFVKRASGEHGTELKGYLNSIGTSMEKTASKGQQEEVMEVSLVDYDEDAEDDIVAGALYAYSNRPMKELLDIARNMDQKEKQEIINSYIGARKNRRHKPGRAFELAYYTFDICTNFGAYRDMHRHRVLTQQRQLLSTGLGYTLPTEITESGYEKEFCDVMEAAKNAYEQISKKYKKQAQYVVPLAYKIRWHMTFNLREAYHLLELRSGRQGHADYRRISQEMCRQMNEAHPTLMKGMCFVDMKKHEFERIEAEKQIDKKIKEIEEKYGT